MDQLHLLSGSKRSSSKVAAMEREFIRHWEITVMSPLLPTRTHSRLARCVGGGRWAPTTIGNLNVFVAVPAHAYFATPQFVSSFARSVPIAVARSRERAEPHRENLYFRGKSRLFSTSDPL
jgi:hypothetical protein